MAKVLIATLFNPDPVLLAANRLGPDKLILLIDHKPTPEQIKALKLIKESLGRVIKVEDVRTEVYDIVSIATKCVEIIDSQDKDDTIYVNMTAGRKTKAVALMYAAYARVKRVKKIAYNPEEDKNAIVYLPKLGFKLTESQKKILETIDQGDFKTPLDLASKVKLSRAMLYRNIDELKDMGYVETEEGIKLTDAGKIARL